jgi:Ca-activated chloride channel homolog
MTFMWPRILYLYFLLPVLVLAYILILRGRRQAAVRYSALSIVKEALGAGRSFRRHVPPLLFLIAFAVLTFAVARPAAYVSLPSDSGTVILAMDISGSMRASDIQPSRIRAAQEAANQFVSGQPSNVRIGVVAFAATATLVQAPTRNKDDVLAAISRFRTQRGTAVGSGILVSLGAIFEETDIDPGLFSGANASGFGFGNSPGDAQGQQLGQQDPQGTPLGGSPAPDVRQPDPVQPGSYKSAVIILLSDGQTNTGPDPLDAAGKAADLGVRVFTVGLGTTGGQILGFGGRSMRVQLDEAALTSIADRTRGRYFKAGSDTDLKQIYKSLSSQLITEKGRSEISALFAAAGALIALVSAILSFLWFGRLA